MFWPKNNNTRVKKALCERLGVEGSVWKALCERLCVKGSLCVLLCSKWRVLSPKRRRTFMVTRCKILEFQMWGRAYFVRSSFLVLTWEGGSNSGASNQIGPRNEIWFSSYPLLTYSSCWWLTIFGLTIGDDNPKWIDIECWNWVWPLIIWWETSDRSNLYLGVTSKVKTIIMHQTLSGDLLQVWSRQSLV